ncbi:glycosyltransferase [Arthrobacter bambusae]|uniref:glycosyltransferase n=1 Tax=Arthrobacter bambusae TaxID=1338426 RepID=UPI0027897FA6|nr:glycosyltransferase [Arthrobacter bambusae]MDQ0209659.1 glycosyltransferase involved in cell wall biosynthesis/O-antigen/teichoic acid export membrane protein [Arthrobacter bambusae]MDQ0234015.1 glycosyltransferase involved in cell wall biosynthesis/O-antigen/teichoic acid export membrane protein [Arthrobacter bambusae]
MSGNEDAGSVLDVSVVIPARNAANWLAECLESVFDQNPREVIVIDGCSHDATVQIARSYGARVISDEGRGLPAARMLGARAAHADLVALIDADVIVPPGVLENLMKEFQAGGFDGLQFGLVSEPDGAGYWGAALAWHHNHSRVRSWFGVSATLMRRSVLLDAGFDESFRSGEDIELRIRLEAGGYRLGVSPTTFVRHRFADSFEYARDQWLQDGAGLARTMHKHPRRAAWLVFLPLLATARGVLLSLATAPRYLPYWAGFVLYNYGAFGSTLLRLPRHGLSLGGNAVWLAAARIAPMAAGLLFWALAAVVIPADRLGLASAVVAATMLTVQLGMLGVGPATLSVLPAQADQGRTLIPASVAAVSFSSLLMATGLLVVTSFQRSGVGTAWTNPVMSAAFFAAALLAAVAYQFDHIAVAQARADRALTRSLVQAMFQLGTLAVCLFAGYRDPSAIVVAVAMGALASVLLGLRQLGRTDTALEWTQANWREVVKVWSPGLRQHALMLADRAPGYVLPLVVAAALNTSAAAAWYVVWMLASAIFFVPQSAGYSLQTAIAADTSDPRVPSPPGLVRRALQMSLFLTGLAGVLLLAAGSLLLPLLGSGYASAWVLLPFLVPALMFTCVTQVYYGVCRSTGRLAEATVVAIAACVLAVAPAPAVAQHFGLTGVSVLWLVSQLGAAVVAGGRLHRFSRGHGTARTRRNIGRTSGSPAHGVPAP